MIQRRKLVLLLATAVAATAASTLGCSTQYIPNTDVEDTSENRRIVAFCERYRRAVEERNVPLLLQLASPTYYEDGGNADASDDMDFSGLKDYLEGKFRDTAAIRYEIRYRRVNRGRQGRILVDCTYSASYRIQGVKEDEWRHTVAENRLELVEDGKAFRIVAGM